MTENYVVNGVTYIVDSKFESAGKSTLADRLKTYIKSDFADLTKNMKGDILTHEYVLTAGKEK